LSVGIGGDNTWDDHANWANARLACNGGVLEPDGPDPDPDPDPSGFEVVATVPTGTFTHSVVTGDVNGDGHLDLVAATSADDAVAVALGNGTGTFAAAQQYDTGPGTFPKYAQLVDVDGDGVLDIVSANQESTSGLDVSVLRGAGDGTFDAPQTYGACHKPHEVEVADFDGDGVRDIAVACWGGDVVALLRGLGDGTFGPPVMHSGGNAGHSLVSADFDGDGHLDLAVAAYQSNSAAVLINDGEGGFAPPVLYPSGSGPHNIQLTDLDADGLADLLVTAELSDAASVLYGRGDGTFEPAVLVDVAHRPKAAFAADFDGDGVLDIVTANTHGNYPNGTTPTSVSILYGDGARGFGRRVDVPVSLTPFAVTVADLAGAGHPHILTANWHSGDVVVLRQPR
jgi:hypothetical protein